jgi:glycosyltransferase involved in cell wall biosynthesis
MPRVSVLLPVADAGEHFDAAIRSVLVQTFDDFEVLALLNGAATSRADALAAAYPDPRIRWICLGLRQLSYAMNHGVEAARGEYLARMDADDVCAPERFAKQVALLDTRPDIGVVGSQVRVIDEHGMPLPHSRRLPVAPEAIRRLQFSEGGVAHPAVMMRREALVSVGGYLGGVYAQDLDLWLRMRRAGVRFANVDEPLLSYRVHPQQDSTRRRRQQYAEAFSLFMRELLTVGDPRFVRGLAQTFARYARAALLEAMSPVRSVNGGAAPVRSAAPRARSQDVVATAAGQPPAFSLVVSTLGRVEPLQQLLASLSRQAFSDFEVVLVDQNDDGRLDALLADLPPGLQLCRLRTPRGLSLGRNAGLAVARGRIVAFPDDDCWYAEDTLERVALLFEDQALDGLSTWIGETAGTEGLGRRPWGLRAKIGHHNLFRLPISASLFVRRAIVEGAAIGFDERIGAGRRIGAGEETWFVHELLDAGARLEYDGSIRVHHPVVADRDPGKAWSYGLGFGFVCRRLLLAGRPSALRPLCRALLRSGGAAVLFALCGDPTRSRTFAARLGSIVVGFVAPPLESRRHAPVPAPASRVGVDPDRAPVLDAQSIARVSPQSAGHARFDQQP